MGAPRTHRAQRVRGPTQLQRCISQSILGFKSWPFRLWSRIRTVHPRQPLSHGGLGTCLCQGQAICARTFLHEFYMQRTYRSGCAHRIRVRAVKAAKSCCMPASLIGVHLGRCDEAAIALPSFLRVYINKYRSTAQRSPSGQRSRDDRAEQSRAEQRFNAAWQTLTVSKTLYSKRPIPLYRSTALLDVNCPQLLGAVVAAPKFAPYSLAPTQADVTICSEASMLFQDRLL